jgi:myo-inositol-1(or 4)-monophosphatase
MTSAPQLADLERMARQAGEILRAGFGQENEVRFKGPIDLVTEMDHRSEACLIDAIREQFPGHRILAEESGEQAGRLDQAWYLDPLDGTVNYAHRIPIFAVSVAYLENGRATLGVVYAPLMEECYSASLGGGAFLNGQALRVSTASELERSLLTTGFPYNIRTNRKNLDYYARFAVRTQGVRRLGSAALDLCYVAAGRYDGYWELEVQPWDIAAGVLIAAEAGARVTAADGAGDPLQAPCSILAASPALHARMAAVLRAAADD